MDISFSFLSKKSNIKWWRSRETSYRRRQRVQTFMHMNKHRRRQPIPSLE